jgi:drug/metabolite transporter (DMT)-like permease
MLWFPLSLLVAFLSAAESAALKKLLGDLGPLQMAGVCLAWTLPFFAAAALFIPFPELGDGFWSTIAILIPLNAAGLLLHWSAVNVGELSLVMPLMSFTPVFVILTGYLILGETVSLLGATGILAIIAGSYLLNLNTRKRGIFEPIKALLHDHGSLMMFGASVFYALSSVLGKKLIILSTPMFAFLVFGSFLNLFTLLLLLAGRRTSLSQIVSRPVSGIATALIMFVHVFFHFLAIALIQTAYMISVKRMNGLFGVLFGRFLFHEIKLFRGRLAGALLMLAGAVCITLWG